MDNAFLREPFRHRRPLPSNAPDIISEEDSVNHLLRNVFRLRLLAVVLSYYVSFPSTHVPRQPKPYNIRNLFRLGITLMGILFFALLLSRPS